MIYLRMTHCPVQNAVPGLVAMVALASNSRGAESNRRERGNEEGGPPGLHRLEGDKGSTHSPKLAGTQRTARSPCTTRRQYPPGGRRRRMGSPKGPTPSVAGDVRVPALRPRIDVRQPGDRCGVAAVPIRSDARPRLPRPYLGHVVMLAQAGQICVQLLNTLLVRLEELWAGGCRLGHL